LDYFARNQILIRPHHFTPIIHILRKPQANFGEGGISTNVNILGPTDLADMMVNEGILAQP
jgi:hypothetical protein